MGRGKNRIEINRTWEEGRIEQNRIVERKVKKANEDEQEKRRKVEQVR